jgi:UDP-hydrolysing UDP-N-acetyl-D-glucosamine 2-epimerase
MTRTIGVVTTARSDYGIYRPILRKILGDRKLRLMLFVSGMHLSSHFGMTVREIERDGFPIGERVPILLDSDSPEGMSKALGEAVAGFAQAFSTSRPDILLVLGDRFEMFAAAVAAVPLNIPIGHIHGGESTYGAIDDSFRHAITKMSHLHFPSTKTYADRLIRMGEEPWRVTMSGAPALDELRELPPPDPAVFEKKCGAKLLQKPLLVTFHPVTREMNQRKEQVDELLSALSTVNMPVIVTQPNADSGGRFIQGRFIEFVSQHKNAWYVENFGTPTYWDAMRLCAAVVGNSSSGIIEAASFGIPAVNIGTRQDGRVRAGNVIDVTCKRGHIADAVLRAVSSEFCVSLKGMVNPYGDGHASERIVTKLKSVEIGDMLLRKVFHDDGVAQ